MIRKLLLTAAVLVVLVATPASAQYVDLTVQPGRVVVGGTVTVGGKSYPAGKPVTVILKKAPSAAPASLSTGGSDERLSRAVSGTSGARLADLTVGEVVATTTADQNGNWTASFKIPAHATTGFYDVYGESGDVSRSQRIEVIGSTIDGSGADNGGGTGADNGGSLPRTGSNLNGVGLFGAGLLAVGGLVLLASRKRRSADAA